MAYYEHPLGPEHGFGHFEGDLYDQSNVIQSASPQPELPQDSPTQELDTNAIRQAVAANATPAQQAWEGHTISDESTAQAIGDTSTPIRTPADWTRHRKAAAAQPSGHHMADDEYFKDGFSVFDQH